MDSRRRQLQELAAAEKLHSGNIPNCTSSFNAINTNKTTYIFHKSLQCMIYISHNIARVFNIAYIISPTQSSTQQESSTYHIHQQHEWKLQTPCSIYTQWSQAHTTSILFMHTHEHICIHFLEKTPRIGIMPKLGFQTVTLLHIKLCKVDLHAIG